MEFEVLGGQITKILMVPVYQMINTDRCHNLLYNTLGFKKIRKRFLKMCLSEQNVICFLKLDIIFEAFMMNF